MDTCFTADSRSDRENSERQSHIENTTTNTTGRKRTAGNMAVHDVRFTASNYSRFPLFQPFELWTPHWMFAEVSSSVYHVHENSMCNHSNNNNLERKERNIIHPTVHKCT